MATPSLTPSASASEQTPAQLAKAALRRLAEAKLEPTPDNFRQAYAQEAETSPSADSHRKAPDVQTSAAEEGERWSTLISRLMRGAERGSRQWTTARKKESIQRVLDGSKNSAPRLHQRLNQLITSWDSEPHDTGSLEGAALATTTTATAPVLNEPVQAAAAPSTSPVDPAPTPTDVWPEVAIHVVSQLGNTLGSALNSPQAAAQDAARTLQQAIERGRQPAVDAPGLIQAQYDITVACEQARRVIEHRHALIGHLTELCQSLTDSLVDLSEDETWVQGQCTAMRHQLNEGLNHRGLRHMQQLLSATRERQRALKIEREAAKQSLKQLIQLMLQELAELGQTTDRFQGSLGRYANTISQADTLESLADVVRDMIDESHSVQTMVSQAHTRLRSEHTRAAELTERVRTLEEEIRKLSSEVSTDPLTQIANRRGMNRAFETEQARSDRAGTPLAIGLLDVDNFKNLNDKLGHQTGDEALKFLARRVSECLRPVDVVARYGGEEFVVMLPDTTVEDGHKALTRLQRTLSVEFFTHEEHQVFITFSAGVTTYRTGEAIETALERADVALYEAKRTGKNRTCMG